MPQYTIETTAILASVIVVLALVLYFILKKLKIKIDEKLAIGLVPWVVTAAFARVLEDAGLYPDTFFTTTPGIIVLFAVIVIPIFCIGKYIEDKKKFPLWKTLAITGAIAAIINAPLLRITNFYAAGMIFIIFAIILGVMMLVRRFVKTDNLSFWAIGAQMFDASATFVALTYFGYSEQHVLPTFLIDFTGPWIMFVVKLIVIIPIVYILDKYCDDKELRQFLLMAVMILGLAPGLRDTLRLASGV
jgi:uncharacterized membrane protein